MNKRIEQALFKDKTTIILRELLAQPEHKWVVRELVERCQVSLGLVARTLTFLDQLGIIEKNSRGRGGYSKLIKTDELMALWVRNYDISLAKFESFYSPDSKIIEKIIKFLRGKKSGDSYALTLHTGANLITNYVLTDNLYIYLNEESFKKYIQEMCDRMIIKKVITGGNLHFIMPYYKKSVFHRCRMIGKYRVVSNLQLYLDLYNFVPRGKQQAVYLKNMLGPGELFV